MSDETLQRAIDDGEAFGLWEPLDESGGPPSELGVYVGTTFEPSRVPSSDRMTLSLRSATLLTDSSVKVSGSRITAFLSLADGALVPSDERAARVLDEYRWVGDALRDRLDWLRERNRRAIAQRDRSPAAFELDELGQGFLAPYFELFPADWDLTLSVDGQSYWAEDHHCVNPVCHCANVLVLFYRADAQGDGADDNFSGEVRLDLHQPGGAPEASTPLAEKIAARLLELHTEALRRRQDEVRRAVLGRAMALAVKRGSSVNHTPAVAAESVGRNDPCPCGSGKKYKKCCGNGAG